MRSSFLLIFILIGVLGISQEEIRTPDKAIADRIGSFEGLVAFWDFHEEAGKTREAMGMDSFPLVEMNGPIQRVQEGPVSGFSIQLDGESYLSLSNSQSGALNIHGNKAEVTLIAWVKWSGKGTGFIGGMWNENTDGGRRQYGLFISLPYYNGKDQVCGHISKSGKASPPFPYSIDYSASKQVVAKNEWCCVGFTYDGLQIKSYYNGVYETRSPELIEHTKGFKGYPNGLVQCKNPYYFPEGMGNNGSDFTIGAVQLGSGMGNRFTGLLGGLVVYNRALSVDEMAYLAGGVNREKRK